MYIEFRTMKHAQMCAELIKEHAGVCFWAEAIFHDGCWCCHVVQDEFDDESEAPF